MAGYYRLLIVCLAGSFCSTGADFERREAVRRTKRVTSNDYKIDVLVLADYPLYQKWLAWSGPDSTGDVKSNMNRYFTLLFTDVNSIYGGITSPDYKISVGLADIQIAETPNSDIALLTSRHYAQGRIQANDVLTSMKAFVQQHSLPRNDHVVLFTGYNLISEDGGISFSSTTGKAYVGSMCLTDGSSVSVVEDTGAFTSLFTVTHEIGHSLNASHDGDNGCRAEDRFIMAGKTMTETEKNKYNPWLFSSCSIQEIKTFTNHILETVNGDTCLRQSETPSTNVVDVAGVKPGQMYTPDEICRRVYNNQSFYCRGKEFGSVSDICLFLACNDPDNRNFCSKIFAPEGTSCGNKKWCESGRCVYSEQAPSHNELCVHGDQPVYYMSSGWQTCGALVKQSPTFCYAETSRVHCCQTCQNISRNVPGCEYGDKVANCSPDNCKQIYPDGYVVDDNCCETCDYKPATWSCSDSAVIDCRTVKPYMCYNFTIAFVCCKTCKDVRNVKEVDCEYGDKASESNCNALTNYGKQCVDEKLKKLCCKTCAKTVTKSGCSETQNSSRIWLLLFLLLFVLSFISI